MSEVDEEELEEVSCELFQKPLSCAPRSLSCVEEDFFMLVSEGKVWNVKRLVHCHTKGCGSVGFDVNCVNFEYSNAMSIAVENGNVEMVKYLFKLTSASKYCTLLKAIHIGDVEMVVFLCEKMRADCDVSQQGEDQDFLENLSPLVVAAMNGHFEIIGYLIERGHSINEPHNPECFCEKCHQTLRYSDPLELAIRTWRTYSAMSNPSYFVYITCDPIHYAFKIHRRLIKLSRIESSFNQRYEELARKIREFAACFAGQCKCLREMELILKKRNTPKEKLTKVYQGEYPRLLMAIDYDQVEFVCNPKVQIALQQKFFGTFEDFAYFSNTTKFFYPFVRILTIPTSYFSFLLHPTSKTATFYASPVNRMLHFMASYVIFLFMLFFESRRDKSVSRKCLVTSFWGKAIFAYFCGWFGGVVSVFINMRPGRFFHDKWNLYDVVTLTMFGLTMAFGIASVVHSKMPCIPGVDRKYWASLDPQLMAEGCFVVANILAYMKLLNFLEVHKVIGPAVVALFHIMKAVLKYAVVSACVLLVYSTAFSNFYSYYSGMSYVDRSANETSFQEESFIDWISSFKTFFWIISRRTEVPAADVIVQNNIVRHLFTQTIGYIALGSFTLIMIGLLMNILVVSMTQTFPSKPYDLQKSWIYARSTIYLYFMHFPVMPPPFNLLPQFYTVRYLREKSYFEKRCKEEDLCDYIKLMNILAERYFNTMKNRGDEKCTSKRHFKTKTRIIAPKTRCRSI
ncbi:hypothetical protein GE061_007044 [Apolygus lucorum]|uniref:Transient receptor ion channel domain-containing protein n=1 Tax=Apolygus lucorum TaxID=248454 RepID=A0A6A4J631_APOLU|nr:hypothetical protein GE061_007044 [Apolygus lucorum]